MERGKQVIRSGVITILTVFVVILAGCNAAQEDMESSTIVVAKQEAGSTGEAAGISGEASTADEEGNPYAPSRTAVSIPPASLPLPTDRQRLALSTAAYAKSGSDSSVLPRKIIYTAEVELVVEDLEKTRSALMEQIRGSQGYVADMSLSGSPGEPRQGSWTIRIPVSRFDGFIEQMRRLGEVQKISTGSEDVSEEYYGVTSRLKAKRVEETRLLHHLRRSTAKLSEILAVEKELARVHSEIEEMEGRIRFLSNQTELTTVTLTAHEARGFTSPKPPSFGVQVARAFGSSTAALRDVGKGIVLTMVALVPWLPVLLLAGWLFWMVVRRRFRPLGAQEEPAPS